MAYLSWKTQTVKFDQNNGFSQSVNFDFGSEQVYQYAFGISGFSFKGATNIQNIGIDTSIVDQGESQIIANVSLLYKGLNLTSSKLSGSVDLVCLVYLAASGEIPTFLLNNTATKIKNGGISTPVKNRFTPGAYNRYNFLSGFNLQFPPPKPQNPNTPQTLTSINLAATNANYPSGNFGIYSIANMKGVNTNMFRTGQQTLTPGYGSISANFLANDPASTASFMSTNNISIGMNGKGQLGYQGIDIEFENRIGGYNSNLFLLQSIQATIPWNNNLYEYQNGDFFVTTPEMLGTSKDNKVNIIFNNILQLVKEGDSQQIIDAKFGISYLVISLT